MDGRRLFLHRQHNNYFIRLQFTHAAQDHTHTLPDVSGVFLSKNPNRRAVMRYSILYLCLVCTILALHPQMLSAATSAQAVPWALSPVIGTLGAGLEFGYRPHALWGVRLSATVHPLPDKIELNRVSYKADGSSFGAGLLFDLFPRRNGFRLSAGLYRFRLKADISSRMRFPNPIYDAISRQTSGAALWNRFGPYFGIGWTGGAGQGRGLSWHGSLGGLYIGKADVGYNLPDISVPPYLRRKYAARLRQVRESVTRQVHRYRWYPVISAGLAYRF